MRKNSQRKLFRKVGIEKPKEATHSQQMKKLLVREPKAKPELTGRAWPGYLSIFDPRYEEMLLTNGEGWGRGFKMPESPNKVGRPIIIGTGGDFRRGELRAMRDMFFEPKYMAAIDPIDSDTRMLQSMFISARGGEPNRNIVYAYPADGKNPYGMLTKERLAQEIDKVLASMPEQFAKAEPGFFRIPTHYTWYEEYIKSQGLEYEMIDKLYLTRLFDR